ncbi:MAG: helicase HerA-like domain-containing protein [Candidatus Micrarchaeia archaeon]|jgi:uncharacterized membrane protein
MSSPRLHQPAKTLFLALFLLLFLAAPSNAWLSGWTHRAPITISPATSAPNQQVNVVLTASNFNYSVAKADGTDLRVTDANDTLLGHYRETWNSPGTSSIWANVTNNRTAIIYVYYGNASASDVSNSSIFNATQFFGNGADGALTNNTGVFNITAHTNGNGGRTAADAVSFTVANASAYNVSAGNTTITLSGTPTGLAANDEVLIINLQGTSTDYGYVGNYETRTIASISGNELTLDAALANNYGNTSLQKIIVQRVPHYTNVTIGASANMTASGWNGTKGGVIFFRANGTVNITGKVVAQSHGFRGGAGCSDCDAQDGESYAGQVGSTTNFGGGGAGLSDGFSCGDAAGGAGHGTAGGSGDAWGGGTCGGGILGSAYGYANLTRLFLGGGGGGDSQASGANGQNGGGIIAIFASNLSVSGAISAAPTVGTGGGGAGGSILLKGKDVSLGSSIVNASGGLGPTIIGDGGQGRIAFSPYTSSSGTTTPSATQLSSTASVGTQELITIPWFNTSWESRFRINVTNSNATNSIPAGASVNFSFNHSLLVSSLKSMANGSDVRIVWHNGSAGTGVDLDRINASGWNTPTANTTLWFKTQAAIPANGTDSGYYVYYNNSAAGNPPENTSNVFQKITPSDELENGLKALWHFDEGSGQYINNSATNNNATLGMTSASGQDDPSWGNENSSIGNLGLNFSQGSQLSFNGINQTAFATYAASLVVTSGLTLSAWFNNALPTQNPKVQPLAGRWSVNTSTLASTHLSNFNASSAVGLGVVGFSGAAFDGRYLYFAPSNNGTRYHGNVLRYDTQADFRTAGSWATYNANITSGSVNNTVGFRGAVFDGRYVYFVPYNDNTGFNGKVLRYDTQADFTTAGSWAAYDAGNTGGLSTKGYFGAVFDGRYVYFVPHSNASGLYHANVLRYDTQADFTTAGSWAAYDANNTDAVPYTVGYAGGVFDGRYVYFVPNANGTAAANAHARALRYDTQASFTTSGSWNAYDAGSSTVRGYAGAAFDGRYVYFAPTSVGGSSVRTPLRYDTQASFTTGGSWTSFDTISMSGSPCNGGTCIDYAGAVFDGRYVHMIPNDTLAVYSNLLRIDTNATYGASAAQGLALSSPNMTYSGGAFDGRYIYYAPQQGSTAARGNVLRYDSTFNRSAYILGIGQAGTDAGFGGGFSGITGMIDTAAGHYVVAAFDNASTGWHHAAMTYNGSNLTLYVDGSVKRYAAATGNVLAGVTDFYFASFNSSNAFFNGSMDEVGLWNRSLQATEVRALYERRKHAMPLWGVSQGAEEQLRVTVSTNVSGYAYVGQTINISGTEPYGSSTVNVSLPANWSLTTGSAGGYYERIYTLQSGDISQTALVNVTANKTGSGTKSGTLTIVVESATTSANATNATTLNATGMNSTANLNFTVQLTFRNYGNGRMAYANITALNATNTTNGAAASGWSVQPAMQQCSNISVGGACTTTFYVIIPAGTANGSNIARIYWLGNWTDNNGGTGATSSNFSAITVAPNPLVSFNATGLNSTLDHSASNATAIRITANGNTALGNVNVTAVAGGGNLNPAWVTIANNFTASVAQNGTVDAAATIGPALGTPPGQYNGWLNVTTAQGAYSQIPINFTVLSNASWTFDAYPNYNKTFGISENGSTATVTINNTGNIPMTFTVNCSAFENILYPQNYSLNDTPSTGPHSQPCITPISVPASNYSTAQFNVNLSNGYAAGGWIYNYTLYLYPNETAATPGSNSTVFYINVTDLPPRILATGINTSFAEVNQTFLFNATVQDDQGISNQSFFFNVTFPNGTVLNYSPIGQSVQQNGNQSGDYILATFFLAFSQTEQQGDNYSVQASVWDNANQNNATNSTNTRTNFSVIGFTNVSLALNATSATVATITNYTSAIRAFLATVNNTGNATAYATNITVTNTTAISSWNYTVSNISDLSAAAGSNQQITLAIGAGTAPSIYNFTVNASWRQANGSIAFNASAISINVTSNKSMNLSGYTNDYLVVSPGSSGQANFTLNNRGNDNLTSTNLSCSGSYCVTFNVALNASEVQNLTAGSARAAHFNVSVPSGTASGYYAVTINATSEANNDSFTVNVQVPDHTSWTVLNPESRSFAFTGVYGESSSNYQTRVRNLGNVEMGFTFNLSGNITSFMSANGSNSSSATLGAISSATNTTNVSLNWTVPNATAFYSGTLTISNGTEETNITINFTSYVLALSANYPNSSSQATNLTEGQNLSINATVTLGGSPLTSNLTFNATLGNATTSVACPVTNAAAAGSVMAMNCTMPALADGKTYNLTLLLNYSTGTANVSINSTSLNSVKYRDTISPTVSNYSAPTVTWNNPGTLQFNWTDNDALQWANVTVRYPNNSVLFQSPYSSANASFPNLTISFSAAELFAVGDYNVTINATDLSGNANNTQYRFEVFNATILNTTATDAAGTALTVNYSLYRPFTGTALVQNNTNSTGGASLNASQREYDINVSISNGAYEIILRNASINSSTTAIATLDIVPPTGVSVTGAKVLQAFAANPLVTYTNATVAFNYSSSLSTLQAYGYSQEYLFLFKCSSWAISTRNCSGNFTLVDNTTNSTTNKALDTVFNSTITRYTANVSSFSAYALVAGRAGDGVCRADLGETCVNSGDCTCEINATTNTTTVINTVYVSTGGGGGGVSGESGLASELSQLRAQTRNLSNVSKQDVESLQKRLAELENRTSLDDRTIAELQAALNKTKSELGISTAAQNIYVELYSTEATQASVHVRNSKNEVSTIYARATGSIADFVQFDKQSVTLSPGEESDFKMVVRVPAGERAGSYNGAIELTQDNATASVPMQVRVLESKERLIDLKIQPLSEVVAPGRTLRNEVSIYNLGESKRIDATLKIQVVNPSSETVLQEIEDQILVETTISKIISIEIPKDAPDGKYVLRAIASYASTANRTREATALAYFRVGRTLLDFTILGLPLWFIISIILTITAVTVFYYYEKREAERKRRYLERIDFAKLPAPGPRSGFIGKIAETHVGAFSELDRLTMHTLIAGATGSGKTVAAQVLVEEALKKGIAVVVFDPTAQWTGFLRQQRNKEMVAQYKDYNMAPSEAQAFKGNIHVVRDPEERIDVKPLLKPGEITIFVLSKLKQTSEPAETTAAIQGQKSPTQDSTPKTQDSKAGAGEAAPMQIDAVLQHLETEAEKQVFRGAEGPHGPSQIELFVANTVNRVFESNLEESKQLRLLLVYDEVHRLLPKFGGSGEGFRQIERAVREFRKWGVGLILVSQVLSDFVGEIKANIGTEIQMRTKYEEDLERIRQKYGDETLKSVVRSGVGVGMVQNSEYNRGAPYFVSFRPLLHNIARLSDKELTDYEDYNEKIGRFARDAAALKAAGKDVFDIELELDLARDKLKKGAFNIVDIYMESITQKIEKTKAK